MDDVVKRARAVLASLDADQAFLFGPEAEPFIAKRKRVTATELELLRVALNFIEKLEATPHERPFSGRDEHGRFVVMALDEREDLYVVAILYSGSNAAAARANLNDSRAEFRELVEPLRRRLTAR